ncbi:hypothetical protein [Paracoccus sp. ME4]|uniref:hypothetical protein n=1 Tax=Paracoccus sp. ME4 TaxID=3138066 RepID=UPI00398A7E86
MRYDLVLAVDTDEGPLLANLIDDDGPELDYVATRITEIELLMLRENRVSLYGVCKDRPWVQILSGKDGLRFGAASGDSLVDDHMADPGTGIDYIIGAVPDVMPALTEVEVLYEFDGPLIVALHDGKDHWLANCSSMGPDGLRYSAGRVSAAELDAIRDEKLSVRAALTDRPWFGMILDAAGYRFTDAYGSEYPERDAPLPGCGLYDKEELPDRLEPETAPLPT